jgi:hypothetical protein
MLTMTTARSTPRIIEEVRTGLFVRVAVETPWPVPLDPEGSMAEAALIEWAKDNVLPWEWYAPLNEERTAWEFVVPVEHYEDS